MALNAAACVLVATELGVAPQDAADALAELTLPPMRMEILEFKGATIVLDAYNASPASMVAAIDTLADLPCKGRRLAVIGEMKELGAFTEEGHRLVGDALSKRRINSAIFFGEQAALSMAAARGVETSMAKSLDDVTQFLSRLRPGDTVLIKGSRAMELEKSVSALMGAVR